MIVYKALNHGKSPYRHWDWPLPNGKRPGKWATIKEAPRLCAVGFHGYLRLEDAQKAGSEVFEMELVGRIVKDDEKAASDKARLLRRLWQFGPEGPIDRGIRDCLTCHRPHDSYIVQKGLAPQWGDLIDGHSYSPESWEDYASRKSGYAARHDAYRAARHEAIAGHKGSGTYLPVVPAFHGPFKEWAAEPDRCGTCGLDRSLHTGADERQRLSDEFDDYDRWDLLLVIQALRAA